ncbi:exocyst subunit EXO84 NDAI_0A07820 [Naumovozyma dairenensis CBS 421]|uniref:Exocyst complex component EXO84 n=1 Tax=Naumovozyma dairenensis (strain ATCC 10597 / BCRC 20456 / CBS 421 / NBRC 0211 / NRRL Y-12639) TaxID=1071378 RepID=G0W548_NAUDC|nr:hypothetical protein NDAI_0A07820 [Naumovozyma dairenensis CBS 421]CCD22936.1 hypothetical protein NDAI_0A07820 [Naumovozyma dairenensis CBS 421]
MVDFSLRKARNNWKKSSSPIRQKQPQTPTTKSSVTSSPSKTKPTKKKNPYANLGQQQQQQQQTSTSNAYSELPTVDRKAKNKVATSMQRRLSIHNANYIPPKLDYSIPLPQGIPPLPNIPAIGGGVGDTMKAPVDSSTTTSNRQMKKESQLSKMSQPKTLRHILSDPKFNAKNFVNENLTEANALDIDKFTSNLTNLSEYVQEEIKRNINDSYHEIMDVNKDLSIAVEELKRLRINIKALGEVMERFETIAKNRLDLEASIKTPGGSSGNSANGSGGLLPAKKTTSAVNGVGSNVTRNRGRDRSSVLYLEKTWDEELTALFKNVEGIQKFITHSNINSHQGRHLLLESNDWMELNINTLKSFQNVKFFILNDFILIVTGKHGRDVIKQNEYVVNQCIPLNDVTVVKDDIYPNRLLLKFINGNNGNCLYQSRSEDECDKLIDSIRKAKDDLCDIFQIEQENSQKIKESFKYLQSQNQQTPSHPGNRESVTKSPIKRQSIGSSVTPKRINSLNMTTTSHHGNNATVVGASDLISFRYFILSMQARSRSNGMSSIAQQLKRLDDCIEEVDIKLTRLKFAVAVDTLQTVENQLTQLVDNMNNDEEMMLYNVLILKIQQRREVIISKLSTSILFSNNDITKLTSNIKTMIKLGLPEQSLDLFLNNRTNLIQDLILQIGAVDNSTNYLIQLAVVRFQTINQTILKFEDIFRKESSCDNKISSILVSWCNEEVNKHFKLIEKYLLNDEKLSPIAIKATRKQLDDLKSVGLDFVYKLDEFLRQNVSRIG